MTAEIDTSAPFRSVKEAVVLFGERVLATELYTNKLQEVVPLLCPKSNGYGEGSEAMASELEETKQSLQKARDERDDMARYLSSLQQELEQTKRELHRFKTAKLGVKNDDEVQFYSKKCVTFANPPLVVAPPPPPPSSLQRHSSLKKTKKKPLIPFIGGIFSRKKGISDVAYA